MRRRRRGADSAKHLSLSATDAHWEPVRAQAAGRGLSIARYVMGLVERDAARERAGPGPHTTESLPPPDPAESPPAPIETVRALFEARLEDMVRAGRHAAAKALLAPIVGAERAGRALSRAVERVARRVLFPSLSG